MKSKKVKSFHQKQCKNVFHKDLNIGLIGLKEAEKKSERELLICERITDTNWCTTENWVNPLNITVGKDGGIASGGERAGNTKCCSAARSISLCSPAAMVIHIILNPSCLFFLQHCGFVKGLIMASKSTSGSQQLGSLAAASMAISAHKSPAENDPVPPVIHLSIFNFWYELEFFSKVFWVLTRGFCQCSCLSGTPYKQAGSHFTLSSTKCTAVRGCESWMQFCNRNCNTSYGYHGFGISRSHACFCNICCKIWTLLPREPHGLCVLSGLVLWVRKWSSKFEHAPPVYVYLLPNYIQLY